MSHLAGPNEGLAAWICVKFSFRQSIDPLPFAYVCNEVTYEPSSHESQLVGNPPFLTGCIRRTYAAIFRFFARVTPPLPGFGRLLL